jgi:acyl dehydratase
VKLPPTGPAARFFDDLAVGETFVTQGRTFTSADGLLWAMYSGDMNPMHVDEEFAREYGIFGGVFPPGLAIVGIASGLNERLGLFVGTGLAMTGQTIRYRKAVLPGDTIRVRLEVKSLTPHPRRPAGTAEFGYEIVTSDGTVCIEGEWGILLATRSMAADLATPPAD